MNPDHIVSTDHNFMFFVKTCQMVTIMPIS
ncbi:DUF2642 domain-containing protein [Radiobacillus deserti]|uniref:DUF2642 domain-containing protein n=1 Tax=Radiobacillus deserti TaxID=2594883 RepID=A0A516KI68_9BACI|nr:DUF2642 domain-containing protein [Radiobacillus deserti]